MNTSVLRPFVIFGQFILVLLSSSLVLPCVAQQVRAVATTGELAPNGGTFSVFSAPIIGRDGAIVSNFTTVGVPARGILRSRGPSSIVVDNNAPVPGGGPGSSFSSTFHPIAALSPSGDLAVTGAVVTAGRAEMALFSFPGGQPAARLLEDGQALAARSGFVYLRGWPSTINARGQVATSVALAGTPNGSQDDEAIVLIPAVGASPVVMVQKGDPAPGGAGRILPRALQSHHAFGPPTMNDSGLVAFAADVTGTVYGDGGVFVTDGIQIREVARNRGAVPRRSGEHLLSFWGSVPIDAMGRVRFVADFTAGFSHGSGVFMGDGNRTESLVLTGDPAPGGGPNDTFRFVTAPLDANQLGQVAFRAVVNLPQGLAPGVFVHSLGRGVRAVVRSGDPAPGGGSFFFSSNPVHGDFVLGDGGHVLFDATVVTSGSSTTALVLHVPGSGLREIVRRGHPLLGSTIDAFRFVGSLDSGGGQRDRIGVNRAGDVAFWFRLVDGRSGIATTAPVGPSSWNDEGCEFGGSLGMPLLQGQGPMTAGSANRFELRNGWPSAVAAFALGLTAAPTPLGGGTLKPRALLVDVSTLSPTGTGAFGFDLPLGTAAGVELWGQWVVLDATAPAGLALSNAVRGVTR